MDIQQMKISTLSVIILVYCLAGCSNKAQNTQASSANSIDSVKVFSIQYENVEKALKLPAELFAFEKASIYAKVPGYINRILVDIGDQVKKGQILLTIEAPEVKAAYAEAQSAIESARAKYLSSKDTYDRLKRSSQTPGTVSASELERAYNTTAADSAALNAAAYAASAQKELLNYLKLRAPFDGVITARYADPGNFVGESKDQPILIVENNKLLRLKVPVPESSTSSQATNEQISFSVPSYPGQTFPAKLSRKSGSIDPVTRTELWEFMVDNVDQKLKSGSFAEAHLSISRGNNSLWVPHAAVLTTLERKAVARVSNGQIEWIEVTTGLKTNDKVEIFADLEEGDTLVVQPTEEMNQGAEVVTQMASIQ